MKKLLVALLLSLPFILSAQTGSELSSILAASSQDNYVIGQGSQLAQDQNITLAAAGTTPLDAVAGGTISYRSVHIQIVPAAGTVTAGVISFEGSNDNFASAAVPVFLYDVSSTSAVAINSYSVVASTPRSFAGNIYLKYFRARISTAITGTTTGVQAFTTYKGIAFNPTVTNLPILGTQTTSNSLAVNIASDQTVNTAPKVNTASGSITTLNSNGTGVATAGSAVEITLNGAPSISFHVTGTYSGFLTVQITLDGTTWINLTGSQLISNAGTLGGNISSAVGVFTASVLGATKARVSSLTSFSSGTASIFITTSPVTPSVGIYGALPTGANSIGAVSIGSGTVTTVTTVGTVTTLSQFAASAAAADATATPTSTIIRSVGHLFNGTSWDRQYNNYAVNTGDAGAKTTTFNGATQTNFNARGVLIVLNVGSVTGTTPTMVVNMQFSSDGGTTWVNAATNIATASIIATGTYGIKVYPGLTAVTASATAGTTSAWNDVVGRTWRLVYTIGGTTPSFTLTNVQVSYLN